MENKVLVRETEADDILILSKTLRQADIDEIEAMNSDPFNSLLDGFVFSEECYTALVDGQIAGMFGVSVKDCAPNTASIWFLGTELMSTVPYDWLTTAKQYINKFLKEYGVLTNFVHRDNTLHIKWLKRMGATFIEHFLNDFIQFFITKEI